MTDEKFDLNKPDEYILEFLEGVGGLVEANSCESHYLWNHWHNELGVSWHQEGSGYGFTVGYLADMPVHVSLLCNVVGGRRILFYHATSRVVDHEMVRAWLDEYMPDTAFEYTGALGCNTTRRLLHTDANNFHIVVPRDAPRNPKKKAA